MNKKPNVNKIESLRVLHDFSIEELVFKVQARTTKKTLTSNTYKIFRRKGSFTQAKTDAILVALSSIFQCPLEELFFYDEAA